MFQKELADFRTASTIEAKKLFGRLDRGLEPTILLLYLRTGRQGEWVEYKTIPEGLPLTIKAAEVRETAKIFLQEEMTPVVSKNKQKQKEFVLQTSQEAHRKTLVKLIEQSALAEQKYSVVSDSVRKGSNAVYLVLQLDRQAYDNHYTLYNRENNHGLVSYCSLLEAVTEAFIKERLRVLSQLEPGKELYSTDERTAEELLREAAKNFLYGISTKVSEEYPRTVLFEACEAISVVAYEGFENRGHLLITYPNNPDIETTLRLQDSVQLDWHRQVRKLLQVSTEQEGVLCDSTQVFGLATVKPSYSGDDENIFSIYFRGTYCWDLSHKGSIIMQMRYGIPQFESETIDKARFFGDAKRIFSEISDAKLERMYGLCMVAAKQKTGAMLIFSADPGSESQRLKKQCTNIVPSALSAEKLLRLSSVDGGVLMDTDCTVFAYGLILDGVVKFDGDAARGSRFNSAVRYFEHHAKRCPTMILVVSEDGMVDVIPQLPPRMRRSQIQDRMQVLRHMKNDQKGRLIFYEAVQWLLAHKQFLSAGECSSINMSIPKILKRINRPGHPVLSIEPFVPNPALDDTYFEPEGE